MNCKPGNLAIIVRFSSAHNGCAGPRDHENIGRIVEVLFDATTISAQHVAAWAVRPVGTLLLSYFHPRIPGGNHTIMSETMIMPDAWLRPISGTLNEDEIVEDLAITS